MPDLIKTKIDAASLTDWSVVQKVKPVRAKPMASLLADQSVLSKFMLSTLEGIQNTKPDSMVCIGAADDVWQQDRIKLLKAYTVTEITPDGWLVCSPKPEAQRHAIEVTEQMAMGEFLLLNTQWGEKQEDGSYAQTGSVGDVILRSTDDITDCWIVKRRMFLSTYEVISRHGVLLGDSRYPKVEGRPTST